MFVVSANAAISDSVKALVVSAGLTTETFCSLQELLDTIEPDRRGCLWSMHMKAV